MPLSFWEKQTFLPPIDVAIIGSGIVGLNAAIELKKKHPQKSIAILERGFLPSGASTKNAGFACFGSLSELLDDLSQRPEAEVFQLIEKRWKGLLRLKMLLGEKGIGYEALGGYEVFTKDEKATYEACADQMNYFNQQLKSTIGQSPIYQSADTSIADFGFKNIAHCILNKAEGQINTGKMMQSLIRLAKETGVLIYNGLDVQSIDEAPQEVYLNTSNGASLQAKQVLVCTNGFAKKLLPALKVQPARNQVLITEPIPQLPFKGCFHYQEGYFYFRNVGNRVLLGGGRHLDKTGETTTDFGQTPLIQEALLQLLKTVILPNIPFEIAHHWSGILGIGFNKSPIIQSISNRIQVAVRLGGMGIAIGSLVGQEAALLLNEKI